MGKKNRRGTDKKVDVKRRGKSTMKTGEVRTVNTDYLSPQRVEFGNAMLFLWLLASSLVVFLH